jgi:GNAT superfamily N-acetyltransferase
MLQVEVHPATAERWSNLETLFGKSGAYAGCWCMFWRLERATFKELKGAGTKATLENMVQKDDLPGLLAYIDGQPVGWCSIGPRENYAALENSRILKRVDEQPVWSIVCFFVTRSFRNTGVTYALLREAVEYARKQNATIVEGYPLDMQSSKLAGQKLSSYAGYMCIASVFREIGFQEVGRASETQLIMRYTINQASGSGNGDATGHEVG